MRAASAALFPRAPRVGVSRHVDCNFAAGKADFEEANSRALSFSSGL